VNGDAVADYNQTADDMKTTEEEKDLKLKLAEHVRYKALPHCWHEINNTVNVTG
jgi:hypothetical protein